MNDSLADQPRGTTPPIRRLGRRRVVSGSPSTFVAGQTKDDAPEPVVGEASEAYEQWLREQRPPHWE